MHSVKPLPSDPSKLLSERLLVWHHENNYGGAVKNLNRTEEELARVSKDTPPLLVAALKERELTFANSATLHAFIQWDEVNRRLENAQRRAA